MPIHEYKCTACGEEYERLVPKESTDCPKCGASDPKRKVSTTSFRLEGGGWALDGYAVSP